MATVLFVAIFVEDLLLPLGVAAGVPYVAVVLLGWWFPKRNQIIILAAISTALILIGYFYSPEGGIPWMVATNRILALFAIWVSAGLLVLVKKAGEKVQKINEELGKRVEERTNELRKNEAMLRAVVDYSPTKIHIKDVEGRYTLINKEAEKLFGVTDEECRGKTSYDLFPKEVADAFMAHDQVVIESGEPTEGEEEFDLEDGVHTFLTVKFPIYDLEGVTAVGAIGTDITERKQAEKARLEAESRFRAIVDASPSAILLKDTDGRYLMANRIWHDWFNPQDQEIKGKTVYDFYSKKKADATTAHDREVIVTGDVVTKYLVTPIAGGSVISTVLMKFPVLDDNGKVVAVGGVRTDITEQKQVEEALRESEERLRMIFENSPIGVSIFSPETNTRLYMNPAMIKLFGADSEEKLLERGIEKTWANPSDLDQLRKRDKKGFVEEIEVERLRLDGTKWWCHIHRRQIEFEGQNALMNWHYDVTERKQAEEAVKASEARLTGILDIAPEAVITINRDMNIQLFNQGAERIFGYKADEVLGQPLEMLIPNRLRDGHGKNIEEFDRSRESYRLMGQRQDISGLKKDGTEFPASASVSKLEIGEEKIFTVMLRDVTEQKQVEDALIAAKEEAEVASRAKSEFLAAMSHDLRTPLNAILGFADILSHQYFGPIDDKYREYANDIHSSGEHLLELVNDILDLSTIEAGKQALVREKLPVEEVIAECAKIISEKARSYGIDLITKVPKNLPSLYADRRATKQILLNLLSNAVKFTPEGGKVTLSVKGSKRETVFMVADTGKGIPAEELAGLTDPFTRGERDPYLAEQGWGLGLTITKSLIDLHDGTLDIKSKVGKGTTVTVTLPNEAPDLNPSP